LNNGIEIHSANKKLNQKKYLKNSKIWLFRYAYLDYKAKVIFSYHGFVGKNQWFNFAELKGAGLQNQPAGFAGQFLYLHWNNDESKNSVDIETYKTLYDIDTELGVEPTGQLHNCLQ